MYWTLSLLLIFAAPPDQRLTVLLFSGLTLLVGGSLYLVRGSAPGGEEPAVAKPCRYVGIEELSNNSQFQ